MSHILAHLHIVPNIIYKKSQFWFGGPDQGGAHLINAVKPLICRNVSQTLNSFILSLQDHVLKLGGDVFILFIYYDVGMVQTPPLVHHFGTLLALLSQQAF